MLSALPWRCDGRLTDLSFDDHGRPYATHGLHPFPAKFPPPLARWAIERFTPAGQGRPPASRGRLLDPFAGSGTTLVEARLTGRHAIGADIDPLARLLARVKATPVDPARAASALAHVEAFWTEPRRAGAVHLPEFPNRDYWFHPRVQADLALLRDAIASVRDRQARDFLLVVYSSVIIAKGPSTVANALDIAHSRAHHIERPDPPDVRTRFRDRARRALRGLSELYEQADHTVQTIVLGHDARALPYRSQIADAVITSPPYVTAIEYPRGHKFSVWWMGDLLGVPNRVYEQLRDRYIGTENVRRPEREALRCAPSGLPPACRGVTAALDDLDALRAGRARRYFADMRAALAEMLRTLRPDGHAVLVVADSNLRGVTVPTGACLVELAESLTVDGARFVHRDTLTRAIRERSRQLPIKRGANGEAMKTEQVLILQRRARRVFNPTAAHNGLGAGKDT